VQQGLFRYPYTHGVTHMTKRLTAKFVENVKPSATRREISDGGSGLWLVVQPSGHKSYAARYRVNGVPRKLTLSSTTLHDARAEAAEALKQAKAGIDLTKVKREANAERAANTFGYIAQRYLDSDKVTKLRSRKQVKDYLDRLILPTFGDVPIVDIRRRQVAELLDCIETNSGPVAADRALSAMTGVFKLYQLRDSDYTSPIVDGMNRSNAKDRARDRTLTPEEIKAVWNTGNAFCKFLLLSACRRSEAAAMQWREINGADWVLPASRNKVKVDLVRTLSKAALAVLPKRGLDTDYVFGNPPDRPLTSFSLLAKNVREASKTSGWVFHDLRRSARTLLSKAGVNADHAERVLGHVIPGIRGTYDRWEFKDEKAHALEALAHQIMLIVDPPIGNVRQLRRRSHG
jgi:integrase